MDHNNLDYLKIYNCIYRRNIEIRNIGRERSRDEKGPFEKIGW